MGTVQAIIAANLAIVAFNVVGMLVAPEKGPPPIWCYVAAWGLIVVTLPLLVRQ